MIITPTELKDLQIIKRDPRIDERGSFVRVFAKEELLQAGIDFTIVHINQGFSKQTGTLRGLHYQIPPKEEAKIFQCVKGKVFDVAVDMRENSPTYRKWFGIELSEDNNTMVYIPKGFAHGYQTLTDNALVEYFVNEYYAPESESGVRWDDPILNIAWPIKTPILSPKDQTLPSLPSNMS
jgi:dTDP-4-dehydrorhamnose 3,5-epimerase